MQKLCDLCVIDEYTVNVSNGDGGDNNSVVIRINEDSSSRKNRPDHVTEQSIATKNRRRI